MCLFGSGPSLLCPKAVCPPAADRNLAAAMTELILCMCVWVCVEAGWGRLGRGWVLAVVLVSQAHGVDEVRTTKPFFCLFPKGNTDLSGIVQNYI